MHFPEDQDHQIFRPQSPLHDVSSCALHWFQKVRPDSEEAWRRVIESLNALLVRSEQLQKFFPIEMQDGHLVM